MEKIWDKIFPFWADFGVLLGKKCLLFFYIPILGIGCEFSPSYSQVIPYIGKLLGHVNPNIGELLGRVNPNIGELLGRVNPNIGELLRQEKSIKGLLLDKSL